MESEIFCCCTHREPHFALVYTLKYNLLGEASQELQGVNKLCTMISATRFYSITKVTKSTKENKISVRLFRVVRGQNRRMSLAAWMSPSAAASFNVSNATFSHDFSRRLLSAGLPAGFPDLPLVNGVMHPCY